MSVIEFQGYRLEKSNYHRNGSFSVETNEINITEQVDAEISIEDDNANIVLKATVGSKKDSSQPFEVVVELVGFFKFGLENSSEEDIEKILKINGTAILYPYLRSAVSSITSLSGEYPNYFMSVINVKDALYGEE